MTDTVRGALTQILSELKKGDDAMAVASRVMNVILRIDNDEFEAIK